MFTVTIATDNAAFEGEPEVEIRRCLLRVIHGLETGKTTGTILDINGNTVGAFVLSKSNDRGT